MAWSAKIGSTADLLLRVDRGDRVSVACDQQDRAIAYTLLEPDGHLDHLYCHPNHTGKGVADRLLAYSENLARRSNAARLYTEASELARPAFLRAGYTVTERRDFSIEFDGQSVPIHNYAMVKPLE